MNMEVCPQQSHVESDLVILFNDFNWSKAVLSFRYLPDSEYCILQVRKLRMSVGSPQGRESQNSEVWRLVHSPHMLQLVPILQLVVPVLTEAAEGPQNSLTSPLPNGMCPILS